MNTAQRLLWNMYRYYLCGFNKFQPLMEDGGEYLLLINPKTKQGVRVFANGEVWENINGKFVQVDITGRKI